MYLVIADDSGTPLTLAYDYDLDLQYGEDSNSFTLNSYDQEIQIQKFNRIWVDGTSFGGIVTKLCPEETASESSITYKGTTLQGILKSHVIMPPSNATHYSVSGEANEVLAKVIAYVGLDDFFTVSNEDSGINISNYKFYRFIDAYSGLRMMLLNSQAKLKFSCIDNQFQISAVPYDLYGDIESELVYFKVERDFLPVNHLIGLGKGEGTARAISHWYADFLGNLSQKQSLNGEYENALTYTLSSEESDTLSTKTKSKLKEYQDSSEADFSIPDGIDLDVDDQVTFSNAKYNVSATTSVSDVVLKVNKGIASVSYKFGKPDFPEDED